jgi:hypothetical protein
MDFCKDLIAMLLVVFLIPVLAFCLGYFLLLSVQDYFKRRK